MILFKPQHVEKILRGEKTQTRRLGKKRWNVGAVHQAKTKLFGEPFARLRITGVRQEPLDEISEEDARREGYANSHEYLGAFRKINLAGAADAHRYWTQLVWVVDFELVKEAT
ncbi:MAG: hypothetical protein A3E78_11750 [Alphaproteobacteria bacterium RIFCSPHIGHO2_12_FULL_63_12]|nr:MAG: hypothetical protein A3E78_11750 [Alphaproteobacteria bacterium RIFCSPHIGHO2_12_FULL_63_12]